MKFKKIALLASLFLSVACTNKTRATTSTPEAAEKYTGPYAIFTAAADKGNVSIQFTDANIEELYTDKTDSIKEARTAAIAALSKADTLTNYELLDETLQIFEGFSCATYENCHDVAIAHAVISSNYFHILADTLQDYNDINTDLSVRLGNILVDIDTDLASATVTSSNTQNLTSFKTLISDLKKDMDALFVHKRDFVTEQHLFKIVLTINDFMYNNTNVGTITCPQAIVDLSNPSDALVGDWTLSELLKEPEVIVQKNLNIAYCTDALKNSYTVTIFDDSFDKYKLEFNFAKKTFNGRFNVEKADDSDYVEVSTLPQ